MSIHPPFVFQSEDTRPLALAWVSSTDASQYSFLPTYYTVFELKRSFNTVFNTFIIHQINHKVKKEKFNN